MQTSIPLPKFLGLGLWGMSLQLIINGVLTYSGLVNSRVEFIVSQVLAVACWFIVYILIERKDILAISIGAGMETFIQLFWVILTSAFSYRELYLNAGSHILFAGMGIFTASVVAVVVYFFDRKFRPKSIMYVETHWFYTAISFAGSGMATFAVLLTNYFGFTRINYYLIILLVLLFVELGFIFRGKLFWTGFGCGFLITFAIALYGVIKGEKWVRDSTVLLQNGFTLVLVGFMAALFIWFWFCRQVPEVKVKQEEREVALVATELFKICPKCRNPVPLGIRVCPCSEVVIHQSELN